MNSTLHDSTILYKAFVKKDSLFEGVAYAGIKTTGIFCRLTCSARKAKASNVEFFRTVQEALEQGYRPCKVCCPLQPTGKVPAKVRHLLEEITQDPALKITDVMLKTRGIDPIQLRRWFRKNYGLTFHAFHRQIRVNQAIDLMQQGGSPLTTAYEVGYDSVSGFSHAIKKVTGLAPGQTKDKKIMITGRISTPLGIMIAAAVDEGICFLGFSDQSRLESELAALQKSFGATLVPGQHRLLASLKQQLGEYFEGSRTTFTLPLVLSGTPFQEVVWRALLKIPYAETRSYGQQAIAIGHPKAVRAVAQANGRNRICILIPCHRVIGSNGTLTGYSAGIARKEWLLKHEGVIKE